MKDNSPSRVIDLMSKAGFDNPELVGQERILFGLLGVAYYQATTGTTRAGH